MPQLIFPVQSDGLIVDVLIGLDGATLSTLVGAGRPVPRPIRARSAIDTGSDVSVVSASILQQLGLPVHHQTTTQTVAGTVNVNLFKVSLGITDIADPGAPELVEPNLLVMELPASLLKIDVLIGLDILLGCKLVLDGPTRRFLLDF
jgi:hypothetical protein